jgi:hypothetical protein
MIAETPSMRMAAHKLNNISVERLKHARASGYHQ